MSSSGTAQGDARETQILRFTVESGDPMPFITNRYQGLSLESIEPLTNDLIEVNYSQSGQTLTEEISLGQDAQHAKQALEFLVGRVKA